ncbi:MAG TPA: glutamate 5-kinase [Armatimonadota bacterium]
MEEQSARTTLATSSRIVVKVGSNLVASPQGVFNRRIMSGIIKEMSGLVREGREVLLVTSGAVRIGLTKMGIPRGSQVDLSTRQAAAAVGQVELMASYNALFKREGCTVGQLLLSGDDFAVRNRYLHIRNTLLPMLHQHNVIPVINENDSVSIEGVQIGENDRLAALIAGKVQCDLLIILSDVEGFYNADPTRNPDARLFREVREITPAMERLAGGSTSGVGRGGMRSKLTAARIATRMGAHTVVALGRAPEVLTRILHGEEIGTLFVANLAERLAARKQWLGFAASPRGTLTIDAGATQALLERGSSLLPVGITHIDGKFHAGDVVSVLDPAGQEVARGLVNYASEELHLIAGKHTDQITAILGYHPYDEAIHRDNLILL